MNTIKALCIPHKQFLTSNNYLRSFYNKRSLANKKNNNSTPSLYSTEQQLQILTTLKHYAEKNTIRTHLSERRLQALQSLFKQYPNLQTLDPLLSINGLGPKALHKLCDSILEEEIEVEMPKHLIENLEENQQIDTSPLKLPSSLITPAHVLQDPVERIVSIELGINVISWARLNVDEGSATIELDCWDVLDLSESADKKYDVHTVWDLAMHLRDNLPDGDVFVMENNNWSNVANVKKPMKYHVQEAMLTTAICSIFNQTDSGRQPRPEPLNRLYFLRTFIPSRLFRTLVGSERVSGQDVVQEMMNGVSDERYTPFVFTNGTAEHYLSQYGALRDNMSRSLMLVVSFNELILKKNPAALSVISKSSKKNKS